MFDLGLGRAANKFVAEHLARGEIDAMRAAATGAVAVQLVTALLGSALFAALVPTLVRDILKVPAALVTDVSRSFYLLVIALPAVLLGTSYSGMLQAIQRFDLVTWVQVLTGVATYGLPVLILAFGGSLTGVVGVVVAVRVTACVAYIALAYHGLPDLRGPFRLRGQALRRLVAYGGWVSVSNVASPVMLYLDRYVIGWLIGLSAVAYYTAPYDVIVRLAVIPASVVPPLFSAFSALGGIGDVNRLAQLYRRTARYLALTMAPLALSLIVLARPGLGAWLGRDFAQHSTLPAQILCVGMAVNALAQLPFATLQAIGRADLTAKFHLIELPLYLMALWLLVSRLGITGAALAWAGRMCLDAALLYRAALQQLSLRLTALLRATGLRLFWPLLVFAGILLAFAQVGAGLTLRLVGVVAATLIGATVAWHTALNEHERAPIKALVVRLLRPSAS